MINRFFNSEFPVLNIDEDYVLREQTVDDTDAFFQYYSDPLVGTYILATNPTTRADAFEELEYCREQFYRKRGIHWAIARRDNNEIIGALGLYMNTQHERAELCYDLSRAHWRKGIMSRAIQTVLHFCFDNIGLNRVEAVVVKENLPSANLVKKVGFIREGTMRNYRMYQGKPRHIEMYAVTPDLMRQRKRETMSCTEAA